MRRFSDFGIKKSDKDKFLDGKKILLDDILNKEIEVVDYIIVNSKYENGYNPKSLKLQVIHEGEISVFFTGSKKLMNIIVENEHLIKLPFKTTITKREKGGYEFN